MAVIATRLARAMGARSEELTPALAGFTLFFCLFSGYFMLRPVREAMGVQAGVQNLQWLFTATFVAMLVAVPLFAWLNSVVPRLRFIDWAYGFCCLNLVGFAALFAWRGGDVTLARTFYVWVSVYNLFVVSVAWSLMADVFDAAQARRLFAFIAAGASVGGLCGPALSTALVGLLDASGLALGSAVLLGLALWLKQYLMRWRETGGAGRPGAAPAQSPRQPVAGNPFSGVATVLASPYLLAMCAFVVLLASVSTFLYFEQARVVAERFASRDQQVRVFGVLDVIVQAGALLSQLFLTGRLAQRLGPRILLAGVPVVMCVGFIGLALLPTFGMLAGLMIVRRIGEYAFIRPGREMLFAPLNAQTKYKAKNFIDTVVYRAGDALSGWAKTLLDSLGEGAWLVALIGAGCAALWAVLGWYLGGPGGAALDQEEEKP
ncbi:NTP/NDP exchange transporter [Pseudomonas typographi]|uniref:NTP/NDP exchange transporter n=1 Tax=Pseudomonas typographi TaxID=2715964 RepID=UPI001688FFEA|nr:MFS transporter [Pseudomonas typographi]MBD1586735.1 MFS transporter [Pseudomonas typographi]